MMQQFISHKLELPRPPSNSHLFLIIQFHVWFIWDWNPGILGGKGLPKIWIPRWIPPRLAEEFEVQRLPPVPWKNCQKGWNEELKPPMFLGSFNTSWKGVMCHIMSSMWYISTYDYDLNLMFFSNHYIRVLCLLYSLTSSDWWWSIDVPNALIHLKRNLWNLDLTFQLWNVCFWFLTSLDSIFCGAHELTSFGPSNSC